jgi:hemoglobin-like flavoprotein
MDNVILCSCRPSRVKAMIEFQTKLVERSIEGIRPVSDQVATLFFSRMSQTSPRFRFHFSADVVRQRQQFFQVLLRAAAALSHPDSLRSCMERVAERHVKHGLSSKDLDAALAAAICAVDHFLGADFKPEVRQAWLALYAELLELAWPKLNEDSLAEHLLIFDLRSPSAVACLWRSVQARWTRLLHRMGS